MVKTVVKEIPLTRSERTATSVKMAVITALGSWLTSTCLNYLNIELDAATTTAIATFIVTGVWKYFRSRNYTKPNNEQ